MDVLSQFALLISRTHERPIAFLPKCPLLSPIEAKGQCLPLLTSALTFCPRAHTPWGVLSQGGFCPQGAFNNVRRHFHCHSWGTKVILGGNEECRCPFSALSQQRTVQPQMSTVQSLRNPRLHWHHKYSAGYRTTLYYKSILWTLGLFHLLLLHSLIWKPFQSVTMWDSAFLCPSSITVRTMGWKTNLP